MWSSSNAEAKKGDSDLSEALPEVNLERVIFETRETATFSRPFLKKVSHSRVIFETREKSAFSGVLPGESIPFTDDLRSKGGGLPEKSSSYSGASLKAN